VRNRWIILAVLFAVRCAMAFQFESVAAIAPLLGDKFDASLADIGVLIGLYFTPGVALSVPGGAIGQKFGDKRTALVGLLFMLIGSLAMGLSDSWPAGIAVALLVLPLLGTAYGLGAVNIAVGITMTIAVILATTYLPPERTEVATRSAPLTRPGIKVLFATSVAGLMWGLYNLGYATIFSFGPSMLVERGWSITTAGSAISIVLWLTMLSVPLGGFLADRLKRPQAILVGGCVLSAVLMVTLPRSDAVIAIVACIGLVSGQPAGPLLSLPARTLEPATRAMGMGVFYTFYYAGVMLGPVVAGDAARWSGSAATALDIGAAAIVACPVLLWFFNRLATNAAGVANAVAR
jgi:MFS family permease